MKTILLVFVLTLSISGCDDSMFLSSQDIRKRKPVRRATKSL